MDFLLEPLAHGFVRRALLAGVALAAAAGFLGTFVVQRGLAFLTDGLAHATFGGIALGLLLGVSLENSPWVALPFAILVALGIGYVRRRTGLGADVATGVFFALSFALGVVCLGLRSPRAPAVDVESLLFGSILAVSEGALWAVLVTTLVTVTVLARLASRLAYATFDPELAALSGVRVAVLEYVLMALVAVVVVAGLRSVGVVLVSALVVLPAATAHLLGARLVTIASLSVGLAVGATLAGLLVSYHLNLATGATIVVLLGGAFFAALAARPARRALF
jgi:zinc transport system permease protein